MIVELLETGRADTEGGKETRYEDTAPANNGDRDFMRGNTAEG